MNPGEINKDIEKLEEILSFVEKGGKIEKEDVEEILWAYEVSNRKRRGDLKDYLKQLQIIGELVKRISEISGYEFDVDYKEFFNPFEEIIKNPSH